VEEIFSWHNPSKTMACACMWVWLCKFLDNEVPSNILIVEDKRWSLTSPRILLFAQHIALNPVYFILIPNFALIWILFSTHTQRYPNGMGDNLGVDPTSGKHVFDDPVKQSPKYVFIKIPVSDSR
jgi:hypothetical protein